MMMMMMMMMFYIVHRSSNIFDNVLAMMQKYADTLESLVDERTAQLAQEKRTTEALLLRMLPKSVRNIKFPNTELFYSWSSNIFNIKSYKKYT